LANRQNQQLLPRLRATVRALKAGHRCPGQTLPPAAGLRKACGLTCSPGGGCPVFNCLVFIGDLHTGRDSSFFQACRLRWKEMGDLPLEQP